MIGQLKIKGIFYRIEGLEISKLKFVKNQIYSQVLPNDIIEYEVIGENEIEIKKILERKKQYTIGIISGRVASLQKFFLYTPLYPSNVNLSIPFSELIYPKLCMGDRCILEVSLDEVKIVKNYGNVLLRDRDDEIISDLYLQSFLFPLSENNNIQVEKKCEGFYTKDFQDLTHLNTFNIDPVHSKDFDDALSIDIERKKIYIHIVDIRQLESLSSLDKRGCWLGYTLYLCNQNFPMLPREYSEDKYSLLKGEERRVITIEIDIEEERDGDRNAPKVKKYEIYPSVIKIKERYHYDNVFENENPDVMYLKKITEMCFFRKLSTPHPKYILDGDGNTLEIRLEKRYDINHFMIEMTMIMANRLVTEHLNDSLKERTDFVVKKSPERYHERILGDLYEEVTDDEEINNILVIQKYRTAFYDPQLSSHYGLSLEHYTHFTSPIRRYFDVIIHRLLGGYDYLNLGEVLTHLNEREVWNESLLALYNQWKMMNYIQHHSTNYVAYVIKVSKCSVKIFIKELGEDIMIHVTNILTNQYWEYNEENESLKSMENEIRRGMKVNVKCVKLDYQKREGVQWRIESLVD